MNEFARRDKFNGLYVENVAVLLAFALRRSNSKSEASDVVAETMLVAWRRIEDVPMGPESRLWLFGVARNVMSNSRRATRRHGRLIEKISSHLDSMIIDENAAVINSDAGRVQKALQSLKPIEAEIISLNVWDELSPSEISELLGMSNEAIRTHLHRARIKLRELIGSIEVAD